MFMISSCTGTDAECRHDRNDFMWMLLIKISITEKILEMLISQLHIFRLRGETGVPCGNSQINRTPCKHRVEMWLEPSPWSYVTVTPGHSVNILKWQTNNKSSTKQKAAVSFHLTLSFCSFFSQFISSILLHWAAVGLLSLPFLLMSTFNDIH